VTGAGGIRGRGAFGMVLALAVALVATSTVAATDDRTVVLPGTTLTAFAVDLDGDGDREIVRITEEDGTDHELDAWRHDGAGWSTLGSTPVPLVDPGPEDRPGSRVDAFALLTWQTDGRERILVLSAISDQSDPFASTCCLELSEVGLTSDGRTETRFLQDVGGGAQYLQAADVDGDGSDDLILHDARIGDTPVDESASMTVLRWSGTRFEPIFARTDPIFLQGVMVGETDGLAGDDLIFGPSTDGRLHRLGWADGVLTEDVTPVDLGGPDGGWILGIAGGAIVLALVNAVSVLRWNRDESATEVSRTTPLLNPSFTVLGDGPDAVLMNNDIFAFDTGLPPTTTVYDLALRPLGEVASTPGTEAFWELVTGRLTGGSGNVQRSLYPYSGPLHGGLDGRDAYVASGVLIQPGGPNGFETRPMSSLIGVQPIGVAGPDDEWVVLGDTFGAMPGTAYLPWGGVPFGWGRLAIVPVDQLLRPDGEVEIASIALRNAVETGRDGDATTLLADGEGFQATVSAMPGTTVLVVNGSRIEEHDVGEEPVVVEIRPRRSVSDEPLNEEFEAMLLVVGPDGRGSTERWTGTFVRESPELSVSAATDGLSLSATLDGRASPGSSVTANGLAVETDAGGRFAISVDAPIWPSQIIVAARDPLGNEVTELVEVVGVVDYRGLPWAAIMVVATLTVGGVLYVRTPRRRPTASVPGDDGCLEELERDVID
jgi:hypothetical protein